MCLPEEKVKQLIELMNSITSVAIPPQQPVLELFDLAMDEKMVDYLIKVGTTTHSLAELKEIYMDMYGNDEEAWNAHWNEIMLRGFIHQDSHEERDTWILTPIFPGWIEFFTLGPKDALRDAVMVKFMEFWKQLTVMNKFPFRQISDFKTKKHIKAGMSPRFTVYPTESSRTKEIVLKQEITSVPETHTKHSVLQILEKHKDELCVGNCLCRSQKKIRTGEDCDYDMPLQSCMMVGAIADNLIKNGSARKLSFEEAKALVEEFDQKGCVHSTFHYKNDANLDEFAICNCCTDCCINYGDYRDGALSKVYTRSFYKPVVVDITRCVGCDICGIYCPTRATYYDKKKKKLMFDESKCVGCGQCITQCKFDVRTLVYEPRDVFATTYKQMKNKYEEK